MKIMKTSKILLTALIIGLFTVTVAQAQNNDETKAKKEMKKEASYTCSMHPDEKSNKPGKCSQCGMALVMIDMEKGNMDHGKMNHDHMKNGNMDMNKMEKKSGDMDNGYMCPMKCEGEKAYAEAGNCPKCGMGLKKVEMKNDGDHEH